MMTVDLEGAFLGNGIALSGAMWYNLEVRAELRLALRIEIITYIERCNENEKSIEAHRKNTAWLYNIGYYNNPDNVRVQSNHAQ